MDHALSNLLTHAGIWTILPAALPFMSEGQISGVFLGTLLMITQCLVKLSALVQIYILEDGKTKKQGTQEELLAQRGLYPQQMRDIQNRIFSYS
ncbi:MAG: hypothetical protein R6U51_06995 [Anaerolineales bacterium]